MSENANELGPHHEPYGVATQPQNTPVKRPEAPQGSGFVFTVKEADGGLVLEMHAPAEGIKKVAVVAGQSGSKNTTNAVMRKCRAMVKEWALVAFGEYAEDDE